MKKLGLVLILMACLVVPGALAYTGDVNISGTVTVDDARVDPNATITWTISQIYNGTTNNPVQNGFGLDFNGSNQYVEVTDAATIKFTQNFTVSFWMNPSTFGQGGNFGRIISKAGAYEAYIDDGTDRLLFGLTGVTGSPFSAGTNSVQLNNNQYWTITRNQVSGDVVFYVNGTLLVTIAGGNELITDTGNNLFIADRAAHDRVFDGLLDEMRLYNRTLGPGESLYSFQNKVPLNQDELAIWLDFDTNVLDQTANGNDGTITGTPDYIRGLRGKADIILDGTLDRVACGSDASMDNIFDGGGSVSVWINPSSDGEANTGRIFDKRNGWYLLVNGEAGGGVRLSFLQDFDGTDGNWFTPLRVIAIGEDTHVVVTYNNDNVANNAIFYINGVSYTVGSGITEGSTPVGTRVSDVGVDLYIGNNAGGARTFNGSIDEARLYNRSMGASEALEQYQGTYSNNTGLVGLWDMDGNVLDTSGEGNNGVITGDPEHADGWANVPVSTSINGQASLVNSSTGLMTLTQSAPATAANYTNVNITVVGASQNQTYALFQVDLYNIDVGALYTEVEATFQTLIYANGSSVLDGHVLTDGDTLIINGVALTWNNYMGRFEGTTTSAIPAIITFDTLTSLIEATYTITNGNITSAPTVVWTTDKLTLLTPFLRSGDWPGAIIQINTLLIGETIFWTLLLTTISIGIYNFSGPEVALLTWMFGWSMFGAVIHSQALTISLILMAVGGGIYIAKFFLDRRTSV